MDSQDQDQDSDVPQVQLINDGHNTDSEHDSPTLDTVSGFSTCSSPLPPEPFEPLFTVKFTGAVEKDGDVVKYTIKSQKTSDDISEYIVQRQYEDFEWLEHCLVTSNPLPGIIIPPLPPKPAITSEMAEAKSKKQLGNDTKTLIGDQFHKDCQQLEQSLPQQDKQILIGNMCVAHAACLSIILAQVPYTMDIISFVQYLRLLLSHHLYGKEETLVNFMVEKEPPARAKVKKGLFTRISDSFEGRKSAHKDCEEFFQKERDWVVKYGSQIKETSEAFNSVIYAQQRLCGVIGHLATAFTLSQGTNENVAKSGTRLCSMFSEALEDSRHGLHILSYNDESTLGAYLDLFVRYIDAERDMLFHRTCLLVEYENANKALDKAKPQKRGITEEAKLAAEKAFEECSDVARQEIKKFHRQRVVMFQESLDKFGQAHLRAAKDMSNLLSKSLTAIKQFHIHEEPIPEE